MSKLASGLLSGSQWSWGKSEGHTVDVKLFSSQKVILVKGVLKYPVPKGLNLSWPQLDSRARQWADCQQLTTEGTQNAQIPGSWDSPKTQHPRKLWELGAK